MGLEARFGPGAGEEASQGPPGPRTALPLRNGTPRHPDAHRQRLEAGLLALGSDPTWLAPAWAEALAWAASLGADVALRVKVDPRVCALAARAEALPVPVSPYRLVALRHPARAERDLPLSPHKGCLGPWNQATLVEARRRGAEDALLLDPDGTVVETAIAAVGLEMGNRLVLPEVQGRVRSIAELWDLPAWADERGWRVVHGTFLLADLSAHPLWCFNALRGLWQAQLLTFPPSSP